MKTCIPLIKARMDRWDSNYSERILRSTLHIVSVALLLGASQGFHVPGRRPVQKSAPVYPLLARKMQIQGVVRVAATVDALGNVLAVESSSLERLLVPAALEAVRKWKFEPGPATQIVMIDVQFTL